MKVSWRKNAFFTDWAFKIPPFSSKGMKEKVKQGKLSKINKKIFYDEISLGEKRNSLRCEI